MIILGVLGFVTLIWLVLIAISIVSRETHPKSGLRNSEKNVIAATIVLFLVWLGAFDAASLVTSKPKVEATTLSSTAGGTATCAAIQTGMKLSEVQSKLGKADEVRNDEKTRGPGAVTWIYRGERCAVHLLDEKVELIE